MFSVAEVINFSPHRLMTDVLKIIIQYRFESNDSYEFISLQLEQILVVLHAVFCYVICSYIGYRYVN